MTGVRCVRFIGPVNVVDVIVSFYGKLGGLGGYTLMRVQIMILEGKLGVSICNMRLRFGWTFHMIMCELTSGGIMEIC